MNKQSFHFFECLKYIIQGKIPAVTLKSSNFIEVLKTLKRERISLLKKHMKKNR